METTLFSLKHQIKRDMAATQILRKSARDLRVKADQLKKRAKKSPSEKPRGSKAQVEGLRRLARTWLNEANANRQQRRLLHLAYAFLRNKTYAQCEPKVSTLHTLEAADIEKLAKMALVPTSLFRHWLLHRDTIRKDLEQGLVIRDQIQEAKRAVAKQKSALEQADRDYLYIKNEVERLEKAVATAKTRLTDSVAKLQSVGKAHWEAQSQVTTLEKSLAT